MVKRVMADLKGSPLRQSRWLGVGDAGRQPASTHADGRVCILLSDIKCPHSVPANTCPFQPLVGADPRPPYLAASEDKGVFLSMFSEGYNNA